MSYDLGMDLLNLRPRQRLGRTEYCFHEAAIRHELQRANPAWAATFDKMTPDERTVAGLRPPFADVWEYDFIWNVNNGPYNWGQRGRVTDMGHSVYLEDGRDKRPPVKCPFQSPEEVWAFDAVAEYGLPDFDELVKFYEDHYQKLQGDCPNQVVTGGYYPTIISGAINTFGWDMLLMGASDERKFEKVLESYFRYSMHYYRAWAQTSIKAFICHDDMVWTSGPFVRPDFYRRVIFPFFFELWKVLRDRGIKLIFCSDGDYTMFVEDLAPHCDGLIFEPMTSLDRVIEVAGPTHAIFGSKVDCRTLTFGSREDIQREVDETLKVAFDCPGFFFAVGNHIPANVPLENALFYDQYLRANWQRK